MHDINSFLVVEVSQRIDVGGGNSAEYNIEIDTTGRGQPMLVNGVETTKVKITIVGEFEFANFGDDMRRLFRTYGE